MNRNLDGIYFRVEREGKWQNICFSDLTIAEIEQVTKGRSDNWWKSVALHLKECLNEIGEELDLIKENYRE